MLFIHGRVAVLKGEHLRGCGKGTAKLLPENSCFINYYVCYLVLNLKTFHERGLRSAVRIPPENDVFSFSFGDIALGFS